MSTTSGVFQFDQGTRFTNTLGSFSEHGVTFTLSSVDSGGGGSFGYYPSTTANSGIVTAVGFSSSSNVTLTLAINKTANFSKFTGSFTVTVAAPFLGSWQVQHQTPIIGTLTSAKPTIVVTALQSGGSEIKFIKSGTSFSNIIHIDSITATINCFLTGTRIAAPGAERAVEDLQPGDRILTADGTETTVKWVGEQPVQPRFQHPAKINPICISAGALAEGVPSRDLFVTPEHAIAVDGMLINAGALVNGTSIYRVAKMPLDGFTYYHIETDAHELLIAENCPAESFFDQTTGGSFVNADQRDSTREIPEIDMIRISAARLVPKGLRTRLMERSGALLAA
jgi:hypothetical protein